MKTAVNTFYLLLAICIIVMILPVFLFGYMEADIVVGWIMRYVAIPILVLATPFLWIFYVKFLKKEETKTYQSRLVTNLRTAFRIIMLTVGVGIILNATTLSLILLTNHWLGNGQKLYLDAVVIKQHSTRHQRMGTRHYVTVQDKRVIDRPLDFQVPRPYKTGAHFKKTMRVGRWGLLYTLK